MRKIVYASRIPAEATTKSASMAPIGAKLRQNAFRTICNFRFFDADKIFSKQFFGRFFFSDFFFRFFVIFVRFWRIWGFLDVKISLPEVFCFRWSNFQVGTMFFSIRYKRMSSVRNKTMSSVQNKRLSSVRNKRMSSVRN